MHGGRGYFSEQNVVVTLKLLIKVSEKIVSQKLEKIVSENKKKIIYSTKKNTNFYLYILQNSNASLKMQNYKSAELLEKKKV